MKYNKNYNLYACWIFAVAGWFIPGFSSESFLAAAFVINAMNG